MGLTSNLYVICFPLMLNPQYKDEQMQEPNNVNNTYEKAVIDELLSLSASFLINIGFWVSRQSRKITVGLSSEHLNWHGLVNEMVRRSPNSKVHFMKHLTRNNLAQLLFYCPDPDTRTMLHMTLSLCLVGKPRSSGITGFIFYL